MVDTLLPAPVPTTRRRRLNDLDGKHWVQSTKTVWLDVEDRHCLSDVETALHSGALLSLAPPRDVRKKAHPATFSETDARRLIEFFTQRGQTVLDPFLGSGSSGVAACTAGRSFVGIELYDEWHRLASTRVAEAQEFTDFPATTDLIQGDSLEVMRGLESESVDFIVTSPPYWGILNKKDHKARSERADKGLATDYGSNELDLGTAETYGEFLSVLSHHIGEYHRLLRPKQYAAIIVSDFRHGSDYYLFHSDIACLMREQGFSIQGLISLVQDNKKLYPYGYPSTFVPNVSNQFVVLGRKLS